MSSDGLTIYADCPVANLETFLKVESLAQIKSITFYLKDIQFNCVVRTSIKPVFFGEVVNKLFLLI